MAGAGAGLWETMTARTSQRAPEAVERGSRVLLTRPAAAAREDFERLEIRRVDDGAIVGSVELSRIARGNFQSAYLGHQIRAEHAGQGYMTEALQLVLRHAFRTLGFHRVEANVQPGNDASLALVRRAGFTREGFSRRYLKIRGRWRDHERWALLKEDWRPARRAVRARR